MKHHMRDPFCRLQMIMTLAIMEILGKQHGLTSPRSRRYYAKHSSSKSYGRHSLRVLLDVVSVISFAWGFVNPSPLLDDSDYRGSSASSGFHPSACALDNPFLPVANRHRKLHPSSSVIVLE
jgi:hypothetical protein